MANVRTALGREAEEKIPMGGTYTRDRLWVVGGSDGPVFLLE